MLCAHKVIIMATRDANPLTLRTALIDDSRAAAQNVNGSAAKQAGANHPPVRDEQLAGIRSLIHSKKYFAAVSRMALLRLDSDETGKLVRFALNTFNRS